MDILEQGCIMVGLVPQEEQSISRKAWRVSRGRKNNEGIITKVQTSGHGGLKFSDETKIGKEGNFGQVL